MTNLAIEIAVQRLQESYNKYHLDLMAVINFGGESIDPLLQALSGNKHGIPIIQALGYLIRGEGGDKAVSRLLGLLPHQGPLYGNVLEALARAGDTIAPRVASEIERYSEEEDDEAVRNLFQLSAEFSDSVQSQFIKIAIELLDHRNPDIREAAADAVWARGLPHGMEAKGKLQSVIENDESEFVRIAAREALARISPEHAT